MGVFLLLFSGLIALLYFCLSRNKTYFVKRGIICDPPSLLFGNLDGVGTKIHMSQNLKLIYEKYKIEHKLCGFFLLHIPQLVVLDLELVKNILIKDFRYFADRGIYNDEKNDPLSANLFSIDGGECQKNLFLEIIPELLFFVYLKITDEKWKRLRKSITHAFTSSRIRQMYNLAQEHSKELINCVDRTLESVDMIDLRHLSKMFIADVIGSVGFGIECNTLRGENKEITEITKMNDIRDDKTRAKFFFIHVFPEIAKRFKMKLTPDSIEELFMRMTKNTFDYRMNNEVNRNDFMSFLMKIHREEKLNEDDESESVVGTITFNELAAQSFLFFSAG